MSFSNGFLLKVEVLSRLMRPMFDGNMTAKLILFDVVLGIACMQEIEYSTLKPIPFPVVIPCFLYLNRMFDPIKTNN